MNLDSRIIDKRIFDSFGIKEAEKYLGKEGYFANSNEMFSDLDNCIFGKLEEIKDDIKPYCDSYLYFRYFLPKEFVSNEINQERKMSEDIEEYKNLLKELEIILDKIKTTKSAIEDIDVWERIHDLEFKIEAAIKKEELIISRLMETED